MRIGHKWHCVNPNCGAELIITESSRLVDADKPKCGCGAVMKRPYERPAVRRMMTSTGKEHGEAPGNEPAWD
jgi:hypothetical protein